MAAPTRPRRPIPTTNEIRQFFHCRRCADKLPVGRSPAEWARLEIGATPLGIQVWCRRCDINVIHIDFEGQKHPAEMRRRSDG